MTDYLRPIAAYVVTRTGRDGHRHTDTDRPGHPTPVGVPAPVNRADSTEDTPDSGADRGWTR
ncbi:hypothetical protein ACIRRA_12970 [Nocardia sp. NPDC101769]|uniref:hypothetical protein n=1 Tax=Nocardia sp. NPDC101769 TaxID=3364333 RepID=UPI003825D07A